MNEKIKLPELSDAEIQECLNAQTQKRDYNDEIKDVGDELEICIVGAERLSKKS